MSARRIVAIGGSDAGISAALRIRELDPSTEVTVVADAHPNFSIGGIDTLDADRIAAQHASGAWEPTNFPPAMPMIAVGPISLGTL